MAINGTLGSNINKDLRTATQFRHGAWRVLTVCMYVRVYVCFFVCLFIFVSLFLCVSLSVSMYVCMCRVALHVYSNNTKIQHGTPQRFQHSTTPTLQLPPANSGERACAYAPMLRSTAICRQVALWASNGAPRFLFGPCKARQSSEPVPRNLQAGVCCAYRAQN